MSASLERRYRAALDWYPSAWRAENGEAMLGTLLDEAEATGREKPRLGDLANLAVFGLKSRLHRLSVAVPARIRDRVSAITLATGFSFALVMFVGAEWAPWDVRGPWNGWTADWRPMGSDVPGFGPFASAAVGLYALWIAAFVLASIGLPRIASITLLLTLPTSLVLLDLGSRVETMRFVSLAPRGHVLLLLAVLAVIASFGLATRRGQRARGALWLLASAALALVALVGHAAPGFTYLDALNQGWAFENRLAPVYIWDTLIDPAFYLAVLTVGGVVFIVRSRYEWAIAVGLAAVPWAIAFLGIALGGGGSLSAAVYSFLVTPAAVAVGYAVVRKRGYRIVLQRREEAPAATSAPLAS
ncbi:hypothetical protein GCM10027413_26410 [Conyzicola nivalis]|uniref:Uncharacterized protein n=1 Tax=Conyzicola nivalis TaxID=1477021 RepID=A0A916S8W8_9MICO|nr:hypothetical protein [Conyzicola nivalis]GGA89423.1 hypothetical protein GCM10010979_00200 [Conyzicola nivalis]